MAAFLSQVMVDGIYVDECSSLTSMSENKCMELSEEEKWAIPIDKWQSEVQEYSLRNWNYKEQLIEQKGKLSFLYQRYGKRNVREKDSIFSGFKYFAHPSTERDGGCSDNIREFQTV
eukprot:scaffold248444_cov71-Cyclotella_meneghiniana.AAC.11